MKQCLVARPYHLVLRQRGLTLIEVMIALTLSIVLLGSVLQIYLSSKQTYRVDEALARLQEGGRIALDVLSHDIRMAGFQGCTDPVMIPATVISTALTPLTDLLTGGLAGTNGDDNPGAAGADSDTLTVRFADPATATAVAAGSTTNTINIVNNAAGFLPGGILLVSDCNQADIFTATAITAATPAVISHDNTANNPVITSNYTAGVARVMSFINNNYFVGPTTRTNARGVPIPALFRGVVGGVAAEIVDGVEYLEVLYGERLGPTSGTTGNLRYVPAGTAGLLMSRVVSVRVGLLMVSDDAVLDADDTRSYSLVGTTIAPGATGAAVYDSSDRRMRRVFTTTVRLRNRR